jgi:hypothetical protein
MSNNTWWQTLISAQGDGSALTAAAAASMLPAAAKFTFPANLLKIGDQFRLTASGRISCVVTTPGTARFDFRMGSAVVWDSGAINLNIVAKTNVGWWLDVLLTVRAIGASTSATILGQGLWVSEAGIAAAANAAGGNASFNVPVSAPAVGTGFDSTTSNVMDSFFTQTVATGSLTLHQYNLSYLT